MWPGSLDFGTCSLPKFPERLTSFTAQAGNQGHHTAITGLLSATSCSVQTVKQESASCKGGSVGKEEHTESTPLPAHPGTSGQGFLTRMESCVLFFLPLLIGLHMRNLASSHCSCKEVSPPGRAAE